MRRAPCGWVAPTKQVVCSGSFRQLELTWRVTARESAQAGNGACENSFAEGLSITHRQTRRGWHDEGVEGEGGGGEGEVGRGACAGMTPAPRAQGVRRHTRTLPTYKFKKNVNMLQLSFALVLDIPLSRGLSISRSRSRSLYLSRSLFFIASHRVRAVSRARWSMIVRRRAPPVST